MATIELCDVHAPFKLEKLMIGVGYEKPELPSDVELRVRENWKRFCASRPNAKDNAIAYLQSYQEEGECRKGEVFLAGYAYNQYFNRDDKEMQDTDIADRLGYNPMASWIFSLCEDGKYGIFGNKVDFGKNKVSGFGGFTHPLDVKEEHIDLDAYIRRVIQDEGGAIVDRLQNVENIGLNYYPLVGPKGFDTVFIATFDGSADDIQSEFRENSQFSRQLIRVNADPKSLVAFLEEQQFEPTQSCVGGVFSFIGARYGLAELQKALEGFSYQDLVKVHSNIPIFASQKE